MKCDWTQKVSLLIDGELAREETREVERHLDLCPDCRQAREDFLLLRRQLVSDTLDLDAFAKQRALKRILAASGSGAMIENETAGAKSRGRKRFAGVFGLPRLSPAGLAALSLLLIGIAVGLVSLVNSRRAPAEVVHTILPPAPVNNAHNDSNINARIVPPAIPNNLTAGTGKQDGLEQVIANKQKHAGEELVRGARGGRTAAAIRRLEIESNEVPKSSSSPNFSQPQIDVTVAEAADNNIEGNNNGNSEIRSGDMGDDAARRRAEAAGVIGDSKTARHVEQAQLLLRSFRNARPAEQGRKASSDIAYDKSQSKKLLYQNIVLRREAASRGNLPVESLLDSLEPILIDIANLSDKPALEDVRAISERMRRKNLIAMLQISSVESATLARSY